MRPFPFKDHANMIEYHEIAEIKLFFITENNFISIRLLRQVFFRKMKAGSFYRARCSTGRTPT